MTLYCGIDLHSNNSVVTVLDEQDHAVYEKRLPNDLETIMNASPGSSGNTESPSYLAPHIDFTRSKKACWFSSSAGAGFASCASTETGLIISASAITEENRLGIRFEFNGLLLGFLRFTLIILQNL